VVRVYPADQSRPAAALEQNEPSPESAPCVNNGQLKSTLCVGVCGEREREREREREPGELYETDLYTIVAIFGIVSDLVANPAVLAAVPHGSTCGAPFPRIVGVSFDCTELALTGSSSLCKNTRAHTSAFLSETFRHILQATELNNT
jgi:hypothetical protein